MAWILAVRPIRRHPAEAHTIAACKAGFVQQQAGLLITAQERAHSLRYLVHYSSRLSGRVSQKVVQRLSVGAGHHLRHPLDVAFRGLQQPAQIRPCLQVHVSSPQAGVLLGGGVLCASHPSEDLLRQLAGLIDGDGTVDAEGEGERRKTTKRGGEF